MTARVAFDLKPGFANELKAVVHPADKTVDEGDTARIRIERPLLSDLSQDLAVVPVEVPQVPGQMAARIHQCRWETLFPFR